MKNGHRYDSIDDADPQSDSSTEVGDWDPESDIKEPRRRRTRRKTFRGTLKSWRWMVDTTLLLIIFGLLAERRWQDRYHSKRHQYELAGDVTGFAPEFSQQIVSFTPDPVFTPENAIDFWSNETQQAWLDIVPEGLGYVNMTDPEKHDDLPTPIHDYPGLTVFTTSVTHQLHCLYTIVEAYNILQITPDPNAIKMPWHINHCFEYIRQAIMCTGDVALEGAATTFPPGEDGEDQGGSDGWDAKHVCKDYSQVYKYLEDKTINHIKWISSD